MFQFFMKKFDKDHGDTVSPFEFQAFFLEQVPANSHIIHPLSHCTVSMSLSRCLTVNSCADTLHCLTVTVSMSYCQQLR